MARPISITAGKVLVQAELNDSLAAQKIWEALPLEESGNRWGEEIYFSIPVTAALDDTAREVVERGDLGYWPPGQAFCIFFGPTPASQGDEVRPASAVNVVGRVTGDFSMLSKVASGTRVRIEKAG